MISWAENRLPKSVCDLSPFDLPTVEKVRAFHRSFPQYAVTPLASLDNLAAALGVGGIYVKDESPRFGLNSFKALGCTFALAHFIANAIGRPVWELNYQTLPQAARQLGAFTFYAATDGNHGRAVAWAARELGQKAVVFMNKGCPQVRLEHIRREGAQASISDLNYDDTIRMAAALAAETPNSAIVQDTAWEGYEDIPRTIMQGYAVMALEALEQMRDLGLRPTHLLLQAGVGAFAGAAQALVANFCGPNAPVSFVVEPAAADCYRRSVLRGDGIPAAVRGEMATIMAGLACGEPSSISWEILKNHSRYFAAIEDSHAAQGMRILGAPLPGDPRVISGESGAASMGFLAQLLTNPDLAALRRQAGIDGNSRILLFSTEGDTDPENYRRVVWDGLYAQ